MERQCIAYSVQCVHRQEIILSFTGYKVFFFFFHLVAVALHMICPFHFRCLVFRFISLLRVVCTCAGCMSNEHSKEFNVVALHLLLKIYPVWNNAHSTSTYYILGDESICLVAVLCANPPSYVPLFNAPLNWGLKKQK